MCFFIVSCDVTLSVKLKNSSFCWYTRCKEDWIASNTWARRKLLSTWNGSFLNGRRTDWRCSFNWFYSSFGSYSEFISLCRGLFSRSGALAQALVWVLRYGFHCRNQENCRIDWKHISNQCRIIWSILSSFTPFSKGELQQGLYFPVSYRVFPNRCRDAFIE